MSNTDTPQGESRFFMEASFSENPKEIGDYVCFLPSEEGGEYAETLFFDGENWYQYEAGDGAVYDDPTTDILRWLKPVSAPSPSIGQQGEQTEWREAYKKAWYAAHHFPVEWEKDEEWARVEKQADHAYYFFSHSQQETIKRLEGEIEINKRLADWFFRGRLAANKRIQELTRELEQVREWVKVGLPIEGRSVIVVTEYLDRGQPKSDCFIGYVDEHGELFSLPEEESYGWQFSECVVKWKYLEPLSSKLSGEGNKEGEV